MYVGQLVAGRSVFGLITKYCVLGDEGVVFLLWKV